MEPAQEKELGVDDAMKYALELQKENMFEAADELYRRIRTVAPDYPNVWHFSGLLKFQLGKVAEGESLIRKALALAPDYPEAHNNLGNVLQHQKRHAEAVSCYEQALALRPDMDDAQYNLGKAYEELGRIDEALTAYQRALKQGTFGGDVYRRLGNVLYASGRIKDAAEIYRVWLRVEPGHAVATHLLKACEGQEVPARASDACVEDTFDRFAESFDEVLLGRLHYRAPALVGRAVMEIVGAPAGNLDVLDAGCGTGLAGEQMKPFARRLEGVDLSQAMLDRAKARGPYDQLHRAELTAFLDRTPDSWDLVISSDTLCYFGDLSAVLTAARKALRPGGHFSFTVEKAAADPERGYQIEPHGRYKHSERYLLEAIRDAGLKTRIMGFGDLRIELGEAVEGLVAVVQRPLTPAG
jgi:predicted TPR repeat methyltransferase